MKYDVVWDQQAVLQLMEIVKPLPGSPTMADVIKETGRQLGDNPQSNGRLLDDSGGLLDVDFIRVFFRLTGKATVRIEGVRSLRT